VVPGHFISLNKLTGIMLYPALYLFCSPNEHSTIKNPVFYEAWIYGM